MKLLPSLICSSLMIAFFFLRANEQSCQKLKKIFFVYEEASGQTINYSKSAIAFRSGVSQADQIKYDEWCVKYSNCGVS